jgi:hypothetical protein
LAAQCHTHLNCALHLASIGHSNGDYFGSHLRNGQWTDSRQRSPFKSNLVEMGAGQTAVAFSEEGTQQNNSPTALLYLK